MNRFTKLASFKKIILLAGVACSCALVAQSQTTGGKKISTDLFGLFFEDINYAADGGLYAEMVQNRSFEYSPAERREWNPFSYWEYITPGYSYGKISVETNEPVHANNPHYMVLTAEHVGHEESFKGDAGVGIKNPGFEGMVVKAGEKYNLSFFARQLSEKAVTLKISLQKKDGKNIAETNISTASKDWKKYTATLTASETYDTASLIILAATEGQLALDVISLFPQNTFKGRANGLRADLAQLLADMHPAFIRFPGGCLTHGDGLDNMYRWKNTIGPIEQRVEQRNIWGYHQTVGLGYYEYFQFCEDIGAKPLPVLPAAVSCQNSGGTWRVGGTGQKALPMDEMQDYIQEVLDLIEWANGPVTSEWGAKRAAAGHPASFNLEYIGIGNEDKITPEFESRFKMIYEAVKAKHPEITVIGTAGPFHSGEDWEKGWQFAHQLQVPVVDEHYYTDPKWFISNQYRYDKYNRDSSEVYLGEYASWGNKLRNAIAEAVYMTSLERNGDVVRMASYAPLFAKDKFTQWTTDMIFFNNTTASLTPNYYVQQLFSANRGDLYFSNVIKKDAKDSSLAASCVQDSKTSDIILKLVNYDSAVAKTMKVDLSRFKKMQPAAEKTVLTGDANAQNTLQEKNNITPVTSAYNISKTFNYTAPPMSLTVIRIKMK
ncbi:alpha-L-arabinofuranosidase C-terminal domain-containing protein [Parafilimonas terrae]|uniref:non-reducing end alpha-L-arabinofuranosidase n=1 Tax=Parafilimonas terrae TaxID=1465490 RepID=A0A1I5R3U0_9BACT|nr:alpha-L-arabinofuranosidase C-terminal domain-containing protein [Parafilimonas terrae]SFP53169.1 Alpha-L-arabinofuranosidase [Parafilimonas terrae]